jgi:hypothetical protein
MTPDISEFSYGYALTEELANGPLGPLTAAPAFPSLLREGKPGGGFDVKLPFAGVPLFLQFKVSHWMERSSALEWALMCGSYYRMHLRSLRHSQQHNLLRKLEGGGRLVYYAAPMFHEAAVLNDAYLGRQVVAKSAFFRPRDIGALDDGNHYIVFRPNSGLAWVCSEEPRRVRYVTGTMWAEGLAQQARGGHPTDAKHLTEELFACVGLSPRLRDTILSGFIERVGNSQEAAYSATVAHLARTYLGCQLLFLSQS